jgi:hypothetical protein
VGVLAAVRCRTQLVGEEPQRGVVSYGHEHVCTRWLRLGL